MRLQIISGFLFSIFVLCGTVAQSATNADSLWFAHNYIKKEYNIPMRDGKHLHTAVYLPKNALNPRPIRMTRTPYSAAPYGESNYFIPKDLNLHYIKDGYIMVIQDVRGRFMSEGDFTDMTPYIKTKTDSTQVDESSDAFDTIEWLVHNIPNNNGNVIIWGSSYPGFYALMSGIDSHPNLKAIVVQAPIADWFIGDDMHHNGAFTIQMAFNFFSSFGVVRDSLTTKWPQPLKVDSPDSYTFFKNIGSIKNINTKFFNHKIPIWEKIIKHETYDEYWQSRNTLPHIRNIKPAVLLVGGWYDAEDFYGTINTYRAIKQNSPATKTTLIIGPWAHSTWNVVSGDRFGDFIYSQNTAQYYRDSVEYPFVSHFVNNQLNPEIPEKILFETGSNKWTFPTGENYQENTLFLGAENTLKDQVSADENISTFISDPEKPVPYTATQIDARRFYNHPFMNEDQRFAFQRPDVISFTTKEYKELSVIDGPIDVELYVTTTGTDADWVVKIIDVFPDSAQAPEAGPNNVEFGGYQMLLRGEIFRGKFRNSFFQPTPFTPGKVEKVSFRIQDIRHAIKPGHKLMVQIQSSWFPLFDRNPQKFLNIYLCEERDFVKEAHSIYYGKNYPSSIRFRTIK